MSTAQLTPSLPTILRDPGLATRRYELLADPSFVRRACALAPGFSEYWVECEADADGSAWVKIYLAPSELVADEQWDGWRATGEAWCALDEPTAEKNVKIARANAENVVVTFELPV